MATKKTVEIEIDEPDGYEFVEFGSPFNQADDLYAFGVDKDLIKCGDKFLRHIGRQPD